MKGYARYIVYVLSLIMLSSCIRDEILPCPPLQVNISVKDKNYFNIESAVKWGYDVKKDETLPFKDYVSTLYYRLDRLETGEMMVEQKLFTVTSGDKEVGVTFPEDIPFGTYVMTTWGNMQSEVPLGDDATSSDLHLYNAQGNDIYLSSDTFVYDEDQYLYTVELERVKGKLLIKAENLPDEIRFSTKDITNVYAYVKADFSYSREALVHTDTLWQKPNEILTGTLLCPSTDIDNSTLSINFYEVFPDELRAGRSRMWIAPEDINISMKRNTLTILRFIYESGGEPIDPPDPPDPDPDPDPEDPDPEEPDPEDPDPDGGGNSKFKMYVLVNDNWENLHSMEIE